jgi:pyruvate formate lyase activating enzyme
MVRASRCRPDGYPCAAACPHGAIKIDSASPTPPRFDRDVCARCNDRLCASACPNGALEVSGHSMSVSELLSILERDRDYWGPDGGVTFSGGEPLYQPEFLLTVLDACREAYIHTAIETSAHADPKLVSDVAELVDWIFVDLKHMSNTAHRSGTGVNNELILSNLERLASLRRGAHVVVRIPVIPGFNDSLDNLCDSARFLRKLEIADVNLLPFHRMAQSKYEQLGLYYAHARTRPPTATQMEGYRRIFSSTGIRCYVGSETPF